MFKANQILQIKVGRSLFLHLDQREGRLHWVRHNLLCVCCPDVAHDSLIVALYAHVLQEFELVGLDLQDREEYLLHHEHFFLEPFGLVFEVLQQHVLDVRS